MVELRALAEELKSRAEEAAMIRSMAERTTALIDGLPKGRGGCRSMMEEMTLRLTAAEERYQRAAEELFWRRASATAAIIENVSDAAARRILLSRYIDGDSWHVIAARMFYSTRQCLRKHNEGLRELSGGAE